MFCFLWTVLHTHRLTVLPLRAPLGSSFKRSCQAFERPSWNNHPLPTCVIFPLYWCHHRPLISSSPWAWNGQSSPAFPFFLGKEKARTVFSLPLAISLQKHHYWTEHTLLGWKRSMGLNVQSCLSWNIPSLVRTLSWNHSTEWAHSPGLWTVLCMYFGMERCLYFS